jgi:DNA mismatch endonuclease (patch repair protein)
MSPETRSRIMARIKSKNTSPERTICLELRRHGVYFSSHAKHLPGRPDIVFRRIRVAVFIDGDFWHGWRFPLWEHKLSEWWRKKIAATRTRDHRNFGRLRRMGWRVIRIWEHQIEAMPERCISRILCALAERMAQLNTKEE